MLSWVEIGLASTMVGFVHCLVLQDNDTPLNFIYLWLNRVERFSEWLYKPLGGCIYCFSGQLALWSHLFITMDFTVMGVIKSLWSAALAITSAYFISHAWEKTRQ